MKNYSIIITIVAILAIVFAGYFYLQSSKALGQIETCENEKTQLKKDKTDLENELTKNNEQLTTISKTTAVLNAALNSFMIPGDLKVSTVGSEESLEVEEKIKDITDKADRMGVEKDWKDFKDSLKVNPLLGLLRTLANNIERNLK